MAVDGVNKWMSVAESGRNPSLTTKFSLSVENDDQADAGWNGRTCLARPNSQARTGTRKYSFSLLS